jgi:hypothetical protein
MMSLDSNSRRTIGGTDSAPGCPLRQDAFMRPSAHALLAIALAVLVTQSSVRDHAEAAASAPRQGVAQQLQDTNAQLREANAQLRALSSDIQAVSAELRRGVDAAEPDLLERIGDLAGVLGIVAAAGALWFAGRSLRVAQDALEPARTSAAAASKQAEAAMTQAEAAISGHGAHATRGRIKVSLIVRNVGAGLATNRSRLLSMASRPSWLTCTCATHDWRRTKRRG